METTSILSHDGPLWNELIDLYQLREFMDILSMADNVVRQIVMHSSVYMMILAVK
jgi:hypothetical protein